MCTNRVLYLQRLNFNSPSTCVQKKETPMSVQETQNLWIFWSYVGTILYRTLYYLKGHLICH